ncbi:MAG: hypothetical protein ACK4V6_14005 [Microthrixaceae bacterium]
MPAGAPSKRTSGTSAPGGLVGCNFIPSTAGNQLEMWQRDTFDPATIDRELGWAAELGRFGADPRVVVWDLFNEPDSPNPYYARREPTRKSERVAALLDQIADWAAVVDPDQPLTVGVYARTVRGAAQATPTARVSLERSDVVSFHCYRSRDGLERTIDHLASYGRPMLCTEWMARPGSPVELLDVLADRGVGAYNWGLVDGRTQTKYPWTSWIRPRRGDGVWFHELLHADGTPYDAAEVERFRRVTGGR